MVPDYTSLVEAAFTSFNDIKSSLQTVDDLRKRVAIFQIRFLRLTASGVLSDAQRTL